MVFGTRPRVKPVVTEARIALTIAPGDVSTFLAGHWETGRRHNHFFRHTVAISHHLTYRSVHPGPEPALFHVCVLQLGTHVTHGPVRRHHPVGLLCNLAA